MQKANPVFQTAYYRTRLSERLQIYTCISRPNFCGRVTVWGTAELPTPSREFNLPQLTSCWCLTNLCGSLWERVCCSFSCMWVKLSPISDPTTRPGLSAAQQVSFKFEPEKQVPQFSSKRPLSKLHRSTYQPVGMQGRLIHIWQWDFF